MEVLILYLTIFGQSSLILDLSQAFFDYCSLSNSVHSNQLLYSIHVVCHLLQVLIDTDFDLSLGRLLSFFDILETPSSSSFAEEVAKIRTQHNLERFTDHSGLG